MPFTLSHPAIVLPLAYLPRKWYSITGLVIGSMTPDFEYFVRMKLRGYYSHTIPGIFFFDLPMGLFLAFVFHNLVRNALFDNLPPFAGSRLAPFKQFEWNRYFGKKWAIVIVSILVGAASHLFWDAFTHTNGYFVKHFSILGYTVHAFGFPVPVCRILQHLSTVAGAILIGYSIMSLPSAQAAERRTSTYWIVLAGLTLLIAGVRTLLGHDMDRLGNLVVTVFSALFISLALTPLAVRIRMRNF